MEELQILNEKELIKVITNNRIKRQEIITAKKYYENENDILKTGVTTENNDGLRNADNRISHNFHQLIVDEKAAYMFTYPVQFNLDNNTEINKSIDELLGEERESIAQELCVEASNAGKAFLHYWTNELDEFEYAVVNSEEVVSKYDNTLKKKLIEVFRYYQSYEGDKAFVSVEHWTDKSFVIYKLKGSIESEDLKLIDTEVVTHEFESVPFIEFRNNKTASSDLKKYKTLIDLADKVMSGYANDIEDIQEVIYILEGYGGEDLQEFKTDLKRFKAIKTDGGPEGGSVKTLQIEIPVEARVKLIDILEKRIYEAGQALQQDTESVGNASGVALKFFYRKLELKAGKTETEFKKGFNALIRAMLKYLNKEVAKINQTYTRNMISNELETSQIAANSTGVISENTILKNHPWVEDVELEIQKLKSERNELNTYDEFSESKVADINE